VPIDPSAVGAESGTTEAYWTSKDCLLYAVGIGAGTDELAFTTENTAGVDQQVFPTFACVAVAGERIRKSTGDNAFAKVGSFNFAMLVHGEQGVTLHKPLPVEAEFTTTGKITGIYDKGSGAVITSESTAVESKGGDPLFTLRSSIFIRGEGGFGGDRGPSTPKFEPDRPADHVVTYKTRPDQALTYRLSGDRNPLHSDPSFAKMGGFDRPILHGLCSFGFTGRALLHTLCDSDPARFTSIDARFSKPVLPGDELTISMWVDGDRATFRTERAPGEVVIDNGVCTFKPA
jgi:acyl dehydratase